MVDVLNWAAQHIVGIIIVAFFFGGTILSIFRGVGQWILQALEIVFHPLAHRRERKAELNEARHERELNRARPRTDPEPLCGCGHHVAHHEDPDVDSKRPCRELMRVETVWNRSGEPIRWDWRECTCTHYVGPEPLPTFYAPEITDSVKDT